MKKAINYIVLLIFLFASCQAGKPAVSAHSNQTKQETKKPKNVILLIGDGMGIAQLYAGYIAKKGHLNAERCKYIGLQKTYSANELITDSGAAGTALATGHKTNNKMIGMTPDGKPVNSILYYAEQNQKTTGLVVACAMTHATPASFVAHEPSRYNNEEIAADFMDIEVDVLIGGGLTDFTKRKDGRNLVDEMKAKGYTFAANMDEVKNFNGEKLAAFLYDGHPPYYAKGRGEMLTEGTLKAIETLSKDEDGFFLMIEGSQIDWAGHKNQNKMLVQEVIDFDNVIGTVLDFAEKDGETLVIITADHETGGYAINGGDLETGKVKGDFTSINHSAVMVPVLAYGPQAETFIGFMQNTDIFIKMYNAFGFDPKILEE